MKRKFYHAVEQVDLNNSAVILKCSVTWILVTVSISKDKQASKGMGIKELRMKSVKPKCDKRKIFLNCHQLRIDTALKQLPRQRLLQFYYLNEMSLAPWTQDWLKREIKDLKISFFKVKGKIETLTMMP
ncbi:hypothetical protein RJT34_23941 [Clitoria ternatea]|uniref:Uncharacterized protein n=1 Tax=Clitoria ternatea TaxID=43366 RepID=A0AAN9IH10_CLITE